MDKTTAQDIEILQRNFDKYIKKAQKNGYSLSYITPTRGEKWLEKSVEAGLKLAQISYEQSDTLISETEVGNMRFTYLFTKDNSELQKALPYLNPMINYFLVYGTKSIDKLPAPSQLRSLNARKTAYFSSPALWTNLDEIVLKTLPHSSNFEAVKDYIASVQKSIPNLTCQTYSYNDSEFLALLYSLAPNSLHSIICDKDNFDSNYRSLLNNIKNKTTPIVKTIPLNTNKDEKKVS